MKIQSILSEAPWYVDKEGSMASLSSISYHQFEDAYNVLAELPGQRVLAKDSKMKYIIGNKRADGVEIIIRLNTRMFRGLSPSQINPPLIQVSGVAVANSFDREGIATSLYEALCWTGVSIISDYWQYSGGKSLWKAVSKRGKVNVYIFDNKTGEFLRDEEEKVITYNGSNVEDRIIWSSSGVPEYEPPFEHNISLIATTQRVQ